MAYQGIINDYYKANKIDITKKVEKKRKIEEIKNKERKLIIDILKRADLQHPDPEDVGVIEDAMKMGLVEVRNGQKCLVTAK